MYRGLLTIQSPEAVDGEFAILGIHLVGDKEIEQINNNVHYYYEDL